MLVCTGTGDVVMVGEGVVKSFRPQQKIQTVGFVTKNKCKVIYANCHNSVDLLMAIYMHGSSPLSWAYFDTYLDSDCKPLVATPKTNLVNLPYCNTTSTGQLDRQGEIVKF